MGVDFKEENKKKGDASWPFPHMVRMPWPYLIIVPVAYALLCGFGWSQDDYVEEQVAEIWIPQDSDYAKDREYADSVGKNNLGGTTMLAMAIARDGGNLFTPNRLEEIRQRMEELEAVTVGWKDETITWKDICASNNAGLGTTYEFVCARITPMDYFQEARWFFEEENRLTWHSEIVRNALVKPIIPRFGIMSQYCATECGPLILQRTLENNEIALMSDIANMEMNNPCKACIETNFEDRLDELTGGVQQAFGLLSLQFQGLAAQAQDPALKAQYTALSERYGIISTTTTRAEIEEFFMYYTTRGLYPQFRLDSYKENYAALMALLRDDCLAEAANDNALICPPATATDAEATQAMFNHADGPFSSVTTAGIPFPWYSSADGTGKLFEGTSGVSGSGIDMSGTLGALFDSENPNYGTIFMTDPVYVWLMAQFDPAEGQCANGVLTGSETTNPAFDGKSAFIMSQSSMAWCTKFDVPNANDAGEGPYNKQHFARMWYELFIDQFLELTEGVDDPYSFTLGQGCGYDLQGERAIYTNQTESDVLQSASGTLYYVDEGATSGAIDTNLLIGSATPAVGDYDTSNPLKSASVIQSIYPALMPVDIVKRVQNCNRPGGSITDMTEAEAKEILEAMKVRMQDVWSKGWDNDDDGEVQMVYFSDDSGAVGTTGQILRDITLDNSTLMSVSIVIIALFSVIFLVSPDWIESRVGVTLVGVALVVLAFFAGLGFTILVGIKINISIAWTLPFIIMGIGVDDVYITLEALKKQNGYSEAKFLRAMREVAVPVSMTSLVNCLMFAVMNISDVGAVYDTATAAVFCVIALYLGVLLCFPAYCWLDMKRQAGGYRDVFFCFKASEKDQLRQDQPHADARQVWLFDKFYKPVMLGGIRNISHAFCILGSLALLGVGIYGTTQYEVGVGLEELFPRGTQGHHWAATRTEALASWSIGMNWGALNYTDPHTQQKMIKQFEDVLGTQYVAQSNTMNLWMANFLVWSTEHCTENFARSDPNTRICGKNLVYEGEGEENGTPCTGSWMKNTYGLREKIFDDGSECVIYEEGICRPVSQMFPEDLAAAGYNAESDGADTSFCPFVDWSDDKYKFCLESWRNVTNYGGGRFIFESEDATPTQCEGETYRDEDLAWPIPFTAGPSMFAFELYSHDITIDLIEQTRAFCDDNAELHCWMSGIPYDYWEQYITILDVLLELSGVSTAVGFGVSWIFLFFKLYFEKRHSFKKVFWGTLVASLLIGLVIIISLISVIGLSVLAGVNLTGFSNMSFVLSVAFSVEYAVHIISRWIRAPNEIENPLDRTAYTMEFLMLPTFMAWVSSTIGVICLAFTEFDFTEVFFFRPLIIVMMVTYFVGCYGLPSLLCHIKGDIFRLGKHNHMASMLGKSDLKMEDMDEGAEEPSKNFDEEPGKEGEQKDNETSAAPASGENVTGDEEGEA